MSTGPVLIEMVGGGHEEGETGYGREAGLGHVHPTKNPALN